MNYYKTFKPNLIPTEFNEQKAFVEYLRLKGYKFTSIPNSTYTTSWKQKMTNKNLGLNPGLPDLLICLPDKLLFIEMKRTKNGRVSEFQKEWIDALNKITNVEAFVCNGCDEAIRALEKIKENH
ncbi:MAG: VRR-NUC domain-containing protein [Pseudomonadota bacterium]